MEGMYDIHCGGQAVGTAKVSREGLYYRFDCQCRLEKKKLCKIIATCGEEKILLGTPIPDGQVFKLRTKLPIKRFANEKPHFWISADNEELFSEFIPVKENEPFLHLKDLKNAVMQVRGGEYGIVIKKQPDA